jgi:toxin-antitoxin system PIN domain toxin
MRALLDVNVLIALLDPDHVHHARAWTWFARHGAAGWASCPLTQNGCVRIMSQPRYANPFSTRTIVDQLRRATAAQEHEFWPDNLSLLDHEVFDHDRLLGHKQITDAYLLALAVSREACLATFDASIPLASVRRAHARNRAVL